MVESGADLVDVIALLDIVLIPVVVGGVLVFFLLCRIEKYKLDMSCVHPREYKTVKIIPLTFFLLLGVTVGE